MPRPQSPARDARCLSSKSAMQLFSLVHDLIGISGACVPVAVDMSCLLCAAVARCYGFVLANACRWVAQQAALALAILTACMCAHQCLESMRRQSLQRPETMRMCSMRPYTSTTRQRLLNGRCVRPGGQLRWSAVFTNVFFCR